MKQRDETLIALLRGINVSGSNRVPMAELQTLCLEMGCREVRTYIQSGNVVLRSSGSASDLEARMEAEIARRFGVMVPVLVRTSAEWSTYISSNPFPEASRDEPNRVLLALSKLPPRESAVDALRERAAGGERIASAMNAVWIHFPAGIGTSKLTPALLDRSLGSPVTTRNWRTVLKLDELCRDRSPGQQ